MLADILLGLIVLGGMAYGMYLMFRVDCWSAEERKLQEEEETREPLPQAVVFGGGSRREQVEKWLAGRGVAAVYIEDVCIRENWEHVQYIIALSESDADNLSICNLIKRCTGQNICLAYAMRRSMRACTTDSTYVSCGRTESFGNSSVHCWREKRSR
ncbi:hypothetical protein [Extibacter muris]|uniref:Uncharacterized protein n=1 Tax=Extibacter muris TaxID=1796622 RepID=A0A4R4FCV0_9FIRM|nr:hypothetical protein [Extibacter muris]MCU0080303.1 hypothetical protein [Extibacter muris]TDA21412.1 hypothetical protein E1963_12155 [Extibacter muris]